MQMSSFLLRWDKDHTSCHVMSRNVASRRVMSRYVALCHVISRHFTSCHVMSRHVTSCHVMSRHVTSCHVMSRHVISRNVTSGHVTSCHVTSCHVLPRHVTSRHVTSCYVISRRKSRDGHTTNASLSTDFFHTQSIQIKHDRVRWLSRRLPIPYRISGIWSSWYLRSFHEILKKNRKVVLFKKNTKNTQKNKKKHCFISPTKKKHVFTTLGI